MSIPCTCFGASLRQEWKWNALWEILLTCSQLSMLLKNYEMACIRYTTVNMWKIYTFIKLLTHEMNFKSNIKSFNLVRQHLTTKMCPYWLIHMRDCCWKQVTVDSIIYISEENFGILLNARRVQSVCVSIHRKVNQTSG